MASITVLKADALKGTSPGASGGDKVGIAPITGVTASTVQQALGELAALEASGPAEQRGA